MPVYPGALRVARELDGSCDGIAGACRRLSFSLVQTRKPGRRHLHSAAVERMVVGRLEINKWRFRMRELTADLFISLDGFASGVNQAAYFGYFGPELGKWVRDHLNEPQIIIMGRVTYQALAGPSASANDEASLRMSSLPK